jgi:1,4-dihydroxy-2-naphthoate octaprenyltransferase
MIKEKVQNKIQTIQSVLYFVLSLWSLDCLYFILYFFFSHWIVCTLFCTFSLVIGLSVFMAKEKVQNKVDNPMAKEKVQNKGQACTFSLTIGLSTLFWTFSFVIGLPDLYFVLFL